MRGMHTIPAAKVDQIIRQIDKDESYDISQVQGGGKREGREYERISCCVGFFVCVSWYLFLYSQRFSIPSLPPPPYLQEEFVAAFQHLATKAMALSSRRLGRPSNLLEFFVYDYGPETAICRWVYSRLGQGPVDEQVKREGGRDGKEGREDRVIFIRNDNTRKHIN